jgi:hypothetical protein
LVEENGGLVSGSYSLTQSDSESISQDVSGNALTGEYTLTQTAIDSEEVWETGTNLTGSFSLTETSCLTTTLTETGNNLTGSWSQAVATTDNYTLHETGNVGLGTFSMMETGLLTTSGTQTGSQVDGSSSVSESANDSYTMTETGSDAYGTFSETVIGTENDTLTQAATATTLTMRSESGNGTYTGTESGPGAALAASGSYSYTLTESGNYQLGTLSITETGADRYSLLAGFNKGTSANGGSGSADFTPFGAPISAGMPAQVATGTDAVGLSSPFAASAPGAAVASPVDASAIVGADTQAQYVAPGPQLFQTFCVSPGTPIRTLTGYILIDDLKKNDEVLAAPEGDPSARPEAKKVVEIYESYGTVIGLKIGGQLIKITPQHRIYEQAKKWIAAGRFEKGLKVRSDDGRWLVVDGVEYTGEYTKLYNFQVADYHTYFIGATHWGFSIWVHNGRPGGCDVSPGGGEEQLRWVVRGFDNSRCRWRRICW